jgi:hypothetical protein
MSNYHRMGNQPPLNVPQEHLHAEVERLRAENAELRARLDDEVPHPTSLKAAWNDVRAIKAKLAWFEERETLIRQGIADEAESNGFDCCYQWSTVTDWEAEHPKPTE